MKLRPRPGSPKRKPRSRPAKVSLPAAASRRIRAPRTAGDTEIGRLIILLERAWEGPSWHGPSVLEAVAGVSAAEAAARPIGASHSIGELVLHMATWKRAVTHRLGGRPYAPGDAENFPPFRAGDWTRARTTLRREHAALRAAFRRLTEA
ncbi:MAG: DinB family protein, partial [Candidatus Eisenbacteria bacterium]